MVIENKIVAHGGCKMTSGGNAVVVWLRPIAQSSLKIVKFVEKMVFRGQLRFFFVQIGCLTLLFVQIGCRKPTKLAKPKANLQSFV